MTIGAPPRIPGLTDAVVPDSVNAIVGTLTGSVTDIQHWQDGNQIDIAEAAATPGQNVEFLFVNVTRIQRVAVSGYYAGSDLHYVNVDLYDYDSSTWKTIFTVHNELGFNLKYAYLPAGTFFDGSGNAKLRIYHPVSGNAAHDSYIDFIGLLP